MNVHAKIARFDPVPAAASLPGTQALRLLGPGDSPVTALVLAGSRGAVDPVAAAEGVAHKALVSVGPVAMLERVLAALREAGVERVLVSADAQETVELAQAAGAEVVPPGAGPSESVARAIEFAGVPLLVTTADHALLSADWIRDFVTNSPETADVAIMLARRQDVEAAVPGNKRTWLRFADGAWSGCNLFLLATPGASLAVDQWRLVEGERKRPWRLAARLGWTTFSEYLVGRLTLADAIARVGRRLGVNAALVPATHGLAAVDVDTVKDLALVRAIVAGRPAEAPQKSPPSWDFVFAPFVEGRGGRGAAKLRAVSGRAFVGAKRLLRRRRAADI